MTSFDLDAGAPQGETFLLQHLLVTFPHDFSPKNRTALEKRVRLFD